MRDLTPAEREDLSTQLDELILRWARKLNEVSSFDQPTSPYEPSESVRLRSRLARITVSERLHQVLADLSRSAASEAVRYGAGYPELGEAAGISRQAARKRWPDLPVPSRGRSAREWKRPPGGLGWATESSQGYPGV